MEYFWNQHGECHSVLLPTPEPMMKEDEKLEDLPMAVVLEPNGQQGQQQPGDDGDDGDEEVIFEPIIDIEPILPIIDQNIKIIPDLPTPNTSNEKKKKDVDIFRFADCRWYRSRGRTSYQCHAFFYGR